ncbi:class I SAM-dependent methyltransferase [Nocardia sp. NPDC058633]|uniref:class I SAM-dependent methyltransferase n=1 Tax=Nocardia sp. NPDC058633 TaxID=3346568 RepID=UPI0036477A89
MSTATEHYDRFLAEHYVWMLGGDIGTVVADQLELFRRLGLDTRRQDKGAAFDLGCGPGTQALALAQLGFTRVTAVDTSAVLLDELTRSAAGYGVEPIVRPVHRDIRGALPDLADPGSVEAVVCMGDTLPHLPGRSDVRQLIGEVAVALRSGGSFVVTYRDLTPVLHGSDRAILVRQADDRILTCLLEYTDDNTVAVHDLLHVRRDGGWTLTTDSYSKLRLPHQWLSAHCRAAGLDIAHDDTGPGGLRVLHAVKP